MRDLNQEYQYQKLPMTRSAPGEFFMEGLFDIHVMIRGHGVGVFEREFLDDVIPENEANEFSGLGMYLSDVMNVEEEYPYDLFLLDLRTERILNGFIP